MFFVFMVLFLAGLYLFGLGISIGSALVFVAGLLAVSGATAMMFYLPSDTRSSRP